MDDLVAKLTAIQRREDLTDAQMAARLGVSRPLWTRARQGKYDSLPRSLLLLRGAMRGFPELTFEGLSFLRSNATTVAENSDSGSTGEVA